MKVEDLNFGFRHLSVLPPAAVRKVVHAKLTEDGFEKMCDLAIDKGITRSAMSQKIKGNRVKYDTIDFGGFKYVREGGK